MPEPNPRSRQPRRAMLLALFGVLFLGGIIYSVRAITYPVGAYAENELSITERSLTHGIQRGPDGKLRIPSAEPAQAPEVTKPEPAKPEPPKPAQPAVSRPEPSAPKPAVEPVKPDPKPPAPKPAPVRPTVTKPAPPKPKPTPTQPKPEPVSPPASKGQACPT